MNRILAIKMRAMGDTVIATAAFEALAQKGTLDVLVPAPWVSVLQENPAIDGIYGAEEPKDFLGRLWFWLKTCFLLRAQNYDLILVFHCNFKTALIAKLISFGKKTKMAVNHHKLKRSSWHQFLYEKFFTDFKVPDRGVLKPNLQRDLDLVRAIAGVTAVTPSVNLKVTDAEKLTAEEMLVGHGWLGARDPILFLGVGASKATKKWPASHYAELIEKIRATDPRWKFLICTIADDEEWLKDFYKNVKNSKSIIHYKNIELRKVMAMLTYCQAYLGNDSGLKHVAVALKIPTVTFFGPEDPFEWHPYDKNKNPYFYTENLPCRTESGNHWCSLEVCVKEKNKCLADISVENVFNVLVEMLKARI